jgi:hypothetical protein
LAAYLYLARPDQLSKPVADIPPILLESNAAYWFLYRYFEAANLTRGNEELIDLYGGGVIDGYQLHRLKTELDQALVDINLKPERWRVLVGWTGERPCEENEDWREVERTELVQVVNALLALTRGASPELKLVCSGD